jgi:hypothetical protein
MMEVTEAVIHFSTLGVSIANSHYPQKWCRIHEMVKSNILYVVKYTPTPPNSLAVIIFPKWLGIRHRGQAPRGPLDFPQF